METSFQLPTSIIANAPGVNGWINPNNILLVDNNFTVSGGSTNILEVGNFNLNIPQGSDITNFTIKVIGYVGSFNTTLQIYAVDNTSGVPLAYPMAPFQGFDGTNTTYTLPSTLFGTTWTVDQANNIKLQLTANGELWLDAILIQTDYAPLPTPNQTVYYTGLTGAFQVGETLSDATSGATGIIATNDGVGTLTLSNVSGSFAVGDSITGLSSSAIATVSTPTGVVVIDEFVEAIEFQLAQSMTSADLYMYLQSFNYPDGVTQIQYADFWGEADITIDPGIQGYEEDCIITSVEQNYQGTGLCRLGFGSLTNRGLLPRYPYTSNPSLIVPHFGTARMVISNSARFYSRFLKRGQIGALVSAPINVDNQGSPLSTVATEFDFTGAGVAASNDGTNPSKKIINIPGSGVNPPNVVSTSSATSGASMVTTLTWNHVSSGINRFLSVQAEINGSATVTGITFNGTQVLTHRVSVVNGSLDNEQWGIIAPDIGIYPIVVTLSAPAYLTCGAETYNTVNQTTPVGVTQTATGTSLSPTLTLTTANDNSLVCDSLSTGTLPIVYTVGSGQTVNWDITANPNASQGASSVQSAGSAPDAVTMSWAITQSIPWAQTAMEIIGLFPPVTGIQSINGDTTPAQTIVGTGGTTVSTVSGVTTVHSTSPVSPGITSINGNTTAAQVIVGSTGISVSSTGGTTTIVNTGSGGGGATQSFIFEDFIGGTATSGQIGAFGWVTEVIGGGSVTIGGGSATNPGWATLTSGSTNGIYNWITLNGYMGDANTPASSYETDINIPVALAGANEVWFGYFNDNSTTGASYTSSTISKIAFLGDATTGEWHGYVSDGSTQTLTAGVAISSTSVFDKLHIAISGSNAIFMVNGVVLGTLSISGISITGETIRIMSGTQGVGGAQATNVDYFVFNRTLTR